ncbi:hypothetical protein C7T94_04165 [Pedobacter yulinensis]|uniref:Glycosyl transferase family 28 C-terminal domain-containing protein n=1 Tax=Pedobacter yulinensis TaxID=2126353 RepID=A0A2T3HND9_9SPHI|nr:glycosyltransferase [Pedobacter yulinensis]PST83946.1 hypothetical protein C7T94_04165 [Pedobacter yulinensis]
MPYKFCFYIHHHGSGHLMRALSIARHLPAADVIFAGSGLEARRALIPAGLKWIDLPSDLPGAGDLLAGAPGTTPSFVHYAPYHIQGLKSRSLELVSAFTAHPQLLLVVDVSVEVALLARLCGVPYVYIRQHGLRNDLPHRLAYEAAEMIIAPYAAEMAQPDQEGRFAEKTLFSGGFSRYTGMHAASRQVLPRVAVFMGQGGTCFDENFLLRLSAQLPATEIHVIGRLPAVPGHRPANCVFHQHLADPSDVLLTCEAVIANAGHNTVMELADLDLPFVCVPDSRPFKEQETKATHLERLRVARVVWPEEFVQADWTACLADAIALKENEAATRLTDPAALGVIARQLQALHATLFYTQTDRQS